LFPLLLRIYGSFFEENDQMSISGVEDDEESCLLAATAVRGRVNQCCPLRKIAN